MPVDIQSIRAQGVTELVGDVLKPVESSNFGLEITRFITSRFDSSLIADALLLVDELAPTKCEPPSASCGDYTIKYQETFPGVFRSGTKLSAQFRDLFPGVQVKVSGGTWDPVTNTMTYTVSEPTPRVVVPITITRPDVSRCSPVCGTVWAATDDSVLRPVGAALGAPPLNFRAPFPYVTTEQGYDTGVPISNLSYASDTPSAMAPGSAITSTVPAKGNLAMGYLYLDLGLGVATQQQKVDLISNSAIWTHTMRVTNDSSSAPVTNTVVVPYHFVPKPFDPLAVIEEGEATEPVLGLSRRRAAESTEPKAQADVVLKNVAPFLFSADLSGKGPADAHVIRILADGTEKVEPAARWDAQLKKSFTIPVTLGNDPVPLILLATGIHNYSHLRNAHVRFGHVFAPVSLIAERTLGLEEIRVVIPESLKNSGEVEVQLVIDGEVSNILTLDIR